MVGLFDALSKKPELSVSAALASSLHGQEADRLEHSLIPHTQPLLKLWAVTDLKVSLQHVAHYTYRLKMAGSWALLPTPVLYRDQIGGGWARGPIR